MTVDAFRKLALGLPSESAHMSHPDFRVRNKIFATLGPDEEWGMVKLSPAQQAAYMRANRKVFEPAKGAWGRRGATIIQLSDAKEPLEEISNYLLVLDPQQSLVRKHL